MIVVSSLVELYIYIYIYSYVQEVQHNIDKLKLDVVRAKMIGG